MKISIYTLAFIALIFFESCASMTGFQDGRTLGKEKSEVSISLNVSQTPDFFFDENDQTFNNAYIFPNLEVTGKYGVSQNFDIGLKINTNLNFSATGKYQFIGDKQSKVAMGVGAEVGTFGLFYSLWNAQLPLYFSLHPSQKFSWYLSPRFIYQFSTADLGTSINYLGANTGILYGSRHKFGIDFGYYSLSNSDTYLSSSLFNIGVCGKFVFGGNDSEEGGSEMITPKPKRKRR